MKLCSQIAFPVQKDGRKAKMYCSGIGIKYGAKTPKTVSVDIFVTAMPSNLFADSVTTSNAIMIPCSAPVKERKAIIGKDREVRLKKGSNTNVTRKAMKAGT